jgi:RNA polymerase sigma factor (sigma-70 family)
LPKRPSSATAEALREQRRLLSRAIEQLEPRQRQVIELREFDRLSFESVGLRMGLSADATRKLHRRAMEVLQQLIESHHASSGDDPCSPQPPQT